MKFWRRARSVGVLLSIAATFLVLPTLVSAQTPTDSEPTTDEDPGLDHDDIFASFGISVSTADLGAVGKAMKEIEQTINARKVSMIATNQELASAERIAAEAAALVASSHGELELSERDLKDQAVRAFTGQQATNQLAFTGSPSDTIYQDSLINFALGSHNDALESLRSSQQSLQARLVEAETARRSVTKLQAETQKELTALEGARDTLQEIQQELVTQRDRRAAPVDASEVVDAGNGILVHTSISDAVSNLLAAAKADGIVLEGGGYRDSEAQIRVRRNNCGTSNYAIYEMPASQCRPATARPGSSMHERGLAIDFTYDGRIIGSRSGPAWRWLAEHAADYGLKNLPGEPWHFSTNGQ